MEEGEDVVVIGDLHLHLDGAEYHAPSVAFGHLIDTISSEPGPNRARRHLVLLGDLLDFDRARGEMRPPDLTPIAIELVDGLAREHPTFIGALQAAASAGRTIHVVAGNHDPEWILPEVAARLATLTGRDGAVRIHPWVLRFARRMHAEHGNHYHDLNAMPRPIDPWAGDAPGLHLGAAIDRWMTEISRPGASGTRQGWPQMTNLRLLPAHARLAFRLLQRALALGSARERRQRSQYRRVVLRAHAPALGLEASAAAAIDLIGEVAPLTIGRRLAATIRHRGPDTRGQALLRRGARRLDATLQRFDSDVPLIVLAHSHVAELTRLREGHWYANPGRWAPDLASAYPYVRAQWTNGSFTVRLLVWDDSARRSDELAAASIELSVVDGVS